MVRYVSYVQIRGKNRARFFEDMANELKKRKRKMEEEEEDEASTRRRIRNKEEKKRRIREREQDELEREQERKVLPLSLPFSSSVVPPIEIWIFNHTSSLFL